MTPSETDKVREDDGQMQSHAPVDLLIYAQVYVSPLKVDCGQQMAFAPKSRLRIL
jgi:hypothetical protein